MRRIRFERRLETPRLLAPALPFVSVAIALVIAAILLLVTGHDPLTTYQRMAEVAFADTQALSSTVASATPLLLTGLAAALAFRVRVWNIGGEGQLYIGAVCAAGAGIAVGGSGLAVALPAMVVAGILGGAAWAAIPGVLRAYLNTNEILTTLMFNYIAGLLMYYLIFDSHSFWRDVSSPEAKLFPQAKELDPSAFWPGFTGGGLIVPLGFLFGVIVAVLLFVLMRQTRLGFELRVVSDSPEVGRYAGMRTRRLVVIVMLISGGVAGLAGASQIGDFSHLLEPVGLQPAAYGYTGIVVAALARFNPLGVVLSALFLGGLTNAGFALQGADFPQGLVGTLQAIILFCVLASELFARYRLSWRTGQATPAVTGQPA
ncbi:MAG: ral nucleoside transport system permease protein [Thermoleophilaceae bacterium]|jgi:simple sugar transport system permease protein|nr:ral nucleoside transport system permease protein [Thermoleophilaceae bacterium]